jgi:hypothetical protein
MHPEEPGQNRERTGKKQEKMEKKQEIATCDQGDRH